MQRTSAALRRHRGAQPGRRASASAPTVLAAALAVVLASACGSAGVGPRGESTTGPEREAEAEPAQPPIVAMQRARLGGRLVFIDESGVRRGDLTRIAQVPVRDNSPSWSPDGRWIVFASSRGREDMMQTSLWLVAARLDAQPRRLTSGDFEDRDPAWSADGSAVVFSSNRGGSFAIWRQELSMSDYGWPIAAGAPSQLIASERAAFHPAPAPDGSAIAYTEADLESGASEIWLWSAGERQRLSEGPSDSTPAWSPDGRRLAFAGLVEREGQPPDVDLFTMNADGSGRAPLIAEPLALQTHPVWSRDGRHLFATSLYRSVDSGKPILSSITFVAIDAEGRAASTELRSLSDPMAVESRASPALGPGQLDAAALARNPSYGDDLARAIEAHLLRRDLGAP